MTKHRLGWKEFIYLSHPCYSPSVREDRDATRSTEATACWLNSGSNRGRAQLAALPLAHSLLHLTCLSPTACPGEVLPTPGLVLPESANNQDSSPDRHICSQS